MTKTITGNFFEDFSLGQVIEHATPRTVTEGDASLYTALYGSRFAVQSSGAFAEAIGYDRAPIDDLLVFHIVFGKTVPDISLNAIANLGYAECRFLTPVFAGDTLSARSELVQSAVRDKLEKRTRQLAEQTGLLDEARLHQEIVIAADRLDITEELVRLRSHIEQFRAIMAEAEREVAVGRRLDFLLQELGREANTVGSKGSDAELAHRVVDLKTELERIREQVQNVE